jgi:hypothetical protein
VCAIRRNALRRAETFSGDDSWICLWPCEFRTAALTHEIGRAQFTNLELLRGGSGLATLRCTCGGLSFLLRADSAPSWIARRHDDSDLIVMARLRGEGRPRGEAHEVGVADWLIDPIIGEVIEVELLIARDGASN